MEYMIEYPYICDGNNIICLEHPAKKSYLLKKCFETLLDFAKCFPPKFHWDVQR